MLRLCFTTVKGGCAEILPKLHLVIHFGQVGLIIKIIITCGRVLLIVAIYLASGDMAMAAQPLG